MEVAWGKGQVGAARGLGDWELFFEWYREVVSQRINNNHNGLIKCLRVPAPFLRVADWIRLGGIDRGNRAFGLVIED